MAHRLRIGIGAGVLSALLGTPAWAVPPGSSAGRAQSSCSTQTGRTVVKSVRGGLIHGIEMICPVAPCTVTVFDSDSATTGNGTARSEGRAASNNSTYVKDFSVPLVTDNGIAYEFDATGGAVCISYE